MTKIHVIISFASILLAFPMLYFAWKICLCLFYKYPNPPQRQSLTATVLSEPLHPCQDPAQHFEVITHNWMMFDQPPDYSNFSPPSYEEAIAIACTMKGTYQFP